MQLKWIVLHMRAFRPFPSCVNHYLKLFNKQCNKNLLAKEKKKDVYGINEYILSHLMGDLS